MRAIIWTGIAGICAVCLVAFLIVPRLLDYKDRIATDSTARAVCAAISAEISNGRVPSFQELDSPAEYDQFIMRLSRHYNLDAPREVAEGKPLFDRWGNRYKIRLKQGGKYFEVISAGPDKRLGSEDDIRAEAPVR